MTHPVRIPESACQFRSVYASGPGGQHVNKNATAVELRVRIADLNLNPGTERRLRTAQRNRINKANELVIQADTHRSQQRNKQEALDRLLGMLTQAATVPRKRIATKPSRASKAKRLDKKKRRGQVKAKRRKPRVE